MSGDALELATHLDDGEGRPVVLLHGFTGSGATMSSLASALVPRPRVTVDLLGHGDSPVPEFTRDPSSWSMDGLVESVVDTFRRLGLEAVHLVGYSFGGRLALSLAVHNPGVIASLALIGASPGLADPSERSLRVDADEELAGFIESEGTAAFVDRWMALPMWRSLRERMGEAWWEQSRRQRLTNSPEGLASSLRGAGTGAMTPLHDHLGSIPVPTLALAGTDDSKYLTIARDMARAIPRAWAVPVPFAGHAAHVEQTATCAELLGSFFEHADR
ncbi:MAG TPA: alpha/beta fold hydrolase [Acidimicrobiales bacterium]|nr:alpha/beta fold hydrolase [Acidimicrobiales bacterium]